MKPHVRVINHYAPARDSQATELARLQREVQKAENEVKYGNPAKREYWQAKASSLRQQLERERQFGGPARDALGEREASSELMMPWEQKQVLNDALTHMRKLSNVVPVNISTSNQVDAAGRALVALRVEIDTMLKLLKAKPAAQDPEDEGKKPPALDSRRRARR